MKNLLALAAAAVLVFAAAGWYLGWYNITRSTDSTGHQKINIDLNSPKIGEDINKGKDKLREFLTTKDQENASKQDKERSSNPPLILPPILQTSSDGTLVLPPPPLPNNPVVPAEYMPRKEPPK